MTIAATVEIATAKLDAVAARFGDVRDPVGRQQWAQALVDLGYANPIVLEQLGEEDEAAEHTLASALDDFRREWQDALQSGMFRRGDAAANAIHVSIDELAPGDIDNFERETLLAFVGFEGTAIASHMPSPGEMGLWSRVLHYRLATLSLYSGAIAAPVGECTRIALLLLSSFVGAHPDDVATFNLLGDARALCDMYLRRHGDEPLVLDGAEVAARPYADLECNPKGFGSIASSAARLGLVGQLAERQRLLALKAARGSARERRVQPANWFGLVLVQWRLWMRGYYVGRVDSLFGPESREALDAAMRDVQDMNPSYARADAIVGVGDGLGAVNPRFALDTMPNVLLAPQKLGATEFVSMLEPIEHDVPPPPPSGVAPAERRGFWAKVASALKEGARSLYKLGRRIYQGVRDTVVRVADVLRRGLEATYYGLKQVAGRVQNVFRVVLSRLEHSVKTVAEGFAALGAYMKGAPLVTTGSDLSVFVFSRFTADADAMLLVNADADASLQRAHCQRRRALMRRFNQALAAIGTVLHYLILVLTTGVLGLGRLAFDIGEKVAASLRATASDGL